jgi:FolB domain-containing protein
MDHIVIRELEVHYRVGVTEAERATPQRLLLNLDLTADLSAAVASDDLIHTVDYDLLCRELRSFGRDRCWRLIEKLAEDIATLVLSRPIVKSVEVEVQKFVIAEARYVAVRISRSRR